MLKFHRETEMAAYSAVYLKMIASKFGGEATINEIRAMNSIFRHHLAGTDVGVSCLSKDLDIPKSTVSRSVLSLRSAGWITEEISGWDGRRRFLRLTPKLLEHYKFAHGKLVQQWPNVA